MQWLERDRPLIANISSEAGSIGKCYRTNMIDYAMSKCALNMATKTTIKVKTKSKTA